MSDIAIKEIELVSLPHFDMLHYLLSQSNGKHVAHCLDLDIVATATTRQEAAEKLDTLVKATFELALGTREYASLVTKAPQNFWNEFHSGRTVEIEPKTLKIEIPQSVQIVPLTVSKLPILARAAHAA